MDYNEWYTAITKHLVDYKLNVLGIPGSGFYGRKQVDHILPRGMAEANYMFDISGISFKKHHGYHHLNSSQTMCVNFFAPLVQDGCKLLSKFLGLLLSEDIKIAYYEFEYTDKTNHGDSNFDFYCRDEKGHNYFFEIKYTEDGIEKSSKPKDSSDENLLRIFDRKYRASVEADGSQLKIDEPLVFMKEHFQAFRLMSCANSVKGDYCIFLTMEGNEKTEKELAESLPFAKSAKYIKSWHWESVVESVLEYTRSDSELIGYYMDFKRKYLL